MHKGLYMLFMCVWFATKPSAMPNLDPRPMWRNHLHILVGEAVRSRCQGAWYWGRRRICGHFCKLLILAGEGAVYVLAQKDPTSSLVRTPWLDLVTWHLTEVGGQGGWKVKKIKAFCAVTCYTVSNDIYNWLLYSTKIHSGLWESDSETPRVSVFRLSEAGDESFNDKVLREGRELYEVVCGFRSKIMVEFTSLLSKFCKIFYCLCWIIYLPLLPCWIGFLSVGPMTSLLSHSR